MLRPASAEFVELCRSQITILTECLKASLSAVYLTEQYLDRSSTQLIPIAAYPDGRQGKETMALLPSSPQPPWLSLGQLDPLESVPESEVLPQADQLILPLVREKMLMGFLVTQRNDRLWNRWEREQIQEIANSLAIACLLDQQAQWSEQQHQQHLQLQQQRHDLLHNFLHQFRNPLTALNTFGKLLLKRLPHPDPNRTIAESILRESARLQDLLQQFNGAMDRLETVPEENIQPFSLNPSGAPVAQLPPASGLGQMPLSLEPCRIETLLEDLLPSIEAIAQDRQLTLHYQIPSHLPIIHADPRALTEVFNNLLENALKYTPSPGAIYLQVAVHSHQPLLLIAISDTGPGIPPEDINHIFERHYRGVQSLGDLPGTGLGLAIAQELITQMQGTIKVFSPAAYPPEATSGTTFVVGLPVRERSPESPTVVLK